MQLAYFNQHTAKLDYFQITTIHGKPADRYKKNLIKLVNFVLITTLTASS